MQDNADLGWETPLGKSMCFAGRYHVLPSMYSRGKVRLKSHAQAHKVVDALADSQRIKALKTRDREKVQAHY